MAQVVPRPELVVAVAEVVVGRRRARVLERGRVPVLVHRVVPLAEVELAVVAVLLLEVLPVVVADGWARPLLARLVLALFCQRQWVREKEMQDVPVKRVVDVAPADGLVVAVWGVLVSGHHSGSR